MASERLLMTAEDLRRALVRMSHEIVERNHGAAGLVLIGLRRRGVPLAERIVRSIASFEPGLSEVQGGVDLPVGALDINLYRDDLSSRPHPVVRPTALPVDIDGASVVLVDDVLFTGRSVRAALDALADLGRPRVVQLAVMVDRGHRELPIRADYVGKNVPTAAEESVEVRVQEIDGRDEVVLLPGPGQMGQAQQGTSEARR